MILLSSMKYFWKHNADKLAATNFFLHPGTSEFNLHIISRSLYLCPTQFEHVP